MLPGILSQKKTYMQRDDGMQGGKKEGEDLGVSKRGMAERWKEIKEKAVKNHQMQLDLALGMH